MKMRSVIPLLAVALLSGCGLAETGATAAADAKAAAEDAKQGKALEDKVRRDLDAAQKKESDSLKKADEEASQ
jgi:hypothetical protein